MLMRQHANVYSYLQSKSSFPRPLRLSQSRLLRFDNFSPCRCTVISVQELIKAGLEDCTVLDVRDYEQYYHGHILGAVSLHPQSLLLNTLTTSRGDRNEESWALDLDPDNFAAIVEAKGVSHDREVVVYDDGSCLAAAWMWWALTVQGHKNVRVLSGGFSSWTQHDGLEEEGDPCCPLKLQTTFEAEQQLQYVITYQELQQIMMVITKIQHQTSCLGSSGYQPSSGLSSDSADADSSEMIASSHSSSNKKDEDKQSQQQAGLPVRSHHNSRTWRVVITVEVHNDLLVGRSNGSSTAAGTEVSDELAVHADCDDEQVTTRKLSSMLAGSRLRREQAEKPQSMMEKETFVTTSAGCGNRTYHDPPPAVFGVVSRSTSGMMTYAAQQPQQSSSQHPSFDNFHSLLDYIMYNTMLPRQFTSMTGAGHLMSSSSSSSVSSSSSSATAVNRTAVNQAADSCTAAPIPQLCTFHVALSSLLHHDMHKFFTSSKANREPEILSTNNASPSRTSNCYSNSSGIEITTVKLISQGSKIRAHQSRHSDGVVSSAYDDVLVVFKPADDEANNDTELPALCLAALRLKSSLSATCGIEIPWAVLMN